jgi:hypothetical protein
MFVAGVRYEQTRILKWIEEHRVAIELDAGIFIYRDNFNSEDLIRFINEKL